MIDHDQQASAHNADIPYDILKQAAMLLVKAREAEQRRSPLEAERLRSNARHMRASSNAKGPALTWSERAGPNSGAIRNAAPLGCLNARYERMVDGVGASKARRFGLELQRRHARRAMRLGQPQRLTPTSWSE